MDNDDRYKTHSKLASTSKKKVIVLDQDVVRHELEQFNKNLKRMTERGELDLDPSLLKELDDDTDIYEDGHKLEFVIRKSSSQDHSLELKHELDTLPGDYFEDFAYQPTENKINEPSELCDQDNNNNQTIHKEKISFNSMETSTFAKEASTLEGQFKDVQYEKYLPMLKTSLDDIDLQLDTSFQTIEQKINQVNNNNKQYDELINVKNELKDCLNQLNKNEQEEVSLSESQLDIQYQDSAKFFNGLYHQQFNSQDSKEGSSRSSPLGNNNTLKQSLNSNNNKSKYNTNINNRTSLCQDSNYDVNSEFSFSEEPDVNQLDKLKEMKIDFDNKLKMLSPNLNKGMDNKTKSKVMFDLNNNKEYFRSPSLELSETNVEDHLFNTNSDQIQKSTRNEKDNNIIEQEEIILDGTDISEIILQELNDSKQQNKNQQFDYSNHLFKEIQSLNTVKDDYYINNALILLKQKVDDLSHQHVKYENKVKVLKDHLEQLKLNKKMLEQHLIKYQIEVIKLKSDDKNQQEAFNQPTLYDLKGKIEDPYLKFFCEQVIQLKLDKQKYNVEVDKLNQQINLLKDLHIKLHHVEKDKLNYTNQNNNQYSNSNLNDNDNDNVEKDNSNQHNDSSQHNNNNKQIKVDYQFIPPINDSRNSSNSNLSYRSPPQFIKNKTTSKKEFNNLNQYQRDNTKDSPKQNMSKVNPVREQFNSQQDNNRILQDKINDSKIQNEYKNNTKINKPFNSNINQSIQPNTINKQDENKLNSPNNTSEYLKDYSNSREGYYYNTNEFYYNDDNPDYSTKYNQFNHAIKTYSKDRDNEVQETNPVQEKIGNQNDNNTRFKYQPQLSESTQINSPMQQNDNHNKLYFNTNEDYINPQLAEQIKAKNLIQSKVDKDSIYYNPNDYIIPQQPKHTPFKKSIKQKVNNEQTYYNENKHNPQLKQSQLNEKYYNTSSKSNNIKQNTNNDSYQLPHPNDSINKKRLPRIPHNKLYSSTQTSKPIIQDSPKVNQHAPGFEAGFEISSTNTSLSSLLEQEQILDNIVIPPINEQLDPSYFTKPHKPHQQPSNSTLLKYIMEIISQNQIIFKELDNIKQNQSHFILSKKFIDQLITDLQQEYFYVKNQYQNKYNNFINGLANVEDRNLYINKNMEELNNLMIDMNYKMEHINQLNQIQNQLYQ